MDKHEHSHGHEHHDHNILRRGFPLVVLLNLVITAAEYAGGILSGSLALISDAGHNLSDVLSLLLGYAGEKISKRKTSEKYTFGMKRFEVLIAFINAMTLIAIGIYIFYEAVERFRNPVEVDFSIMLPVAAVGLAGNLFSMLLLGHSHESSLNVRAAFLHLFFDALSSVAVIAAGILIYFTSNYWIDIVISFFIAVMIIWSSLGILRESLRIFMQGVPGNIDSGEVYNAILGMEYIESIHGLHIWSINSREVFLSCHICVKSELQGGTDSVIISTNTMLKDTFGIEHTTIQVESGFFCGGYSGECCTH